MVNMHLLTAQRRYPPVALIECVADLTQPHYKVRRLHLVIVDLWRPWKIHKSQVRSLTDQLRRWQPGLQADNTTPMMPMRSKTPLHGRRFVYGCGLGGSDFPCYLIWPWRTASNSFFLLESQSRRYVALDQAGFLHPLGIRHFYDGFSLRAAFDLFMDSYLWLAGIMLFFTNCCILFYQCKSPHIVPLWFLFLCKSKGPLGAACGVRGRCG